MRGPATKVPRPPVERRLSAGSSVAPASDAYVAFGNVGMRNTLQARIKVPLLIRALGLPRGGRVLQCVASDSPTRLLVLVEER